METINDENTVLHEETAVMLGDFDGLHTAHTELICRGIEYAHKNGLKSGILLFDVNTKSVTANRNAQLITPYKEKLRLLDGMGIDFAYTVSFNESFMKKTPEEFVLLLKDKLNCKAVFAGYDYRFGYKAEGDAKLLAGLGEKYGFKAVILPEFKLSGITVSSTYIRNCIKDGNIEEANKLLGRCFCVCGDVEHGLQNGRKLGFPTANVGVGGNMLIPGSGVYAGFTYVNGEKYGSVINVGKNPTFGAEKTTVESHIIGFSDDIYGKYVRVEFVKRIRGDIKFENIGKLAEQIKKDTATAEKILNGEEL